MIFIYLLIIVIGTFSIQKAQAQCELTLAELENMCSYNLNQFSSFVIKKGYQEILRSEDNSRVDHFCSGAKAFLNFQEDRIDFTKIQTSYFQKIVNAIKIKGYKVNHVLTSSNNDEKVILNTYTNSKFQIDATQIPDGTNSIIFRLKDKVYEAVENYNSEPTSSKVIAMHISTNRLEIDSYTNSTDITIKKGDKINISASGSITYGAWAGSGGPDGIDGYTSYNRISGFRHGSLLVRIGDNGEWEAIGTSKSIIAKNSGVLQFIVNDGDPSNNSGVFTVDIRIAKTK